MNDFQLLNWNPSNSGFSYPGMVKIYTEGDGSCFFHAIVSAFFKPYITGMIENTALDRNQYIRNLRTDLSRQLKYHYDKLSRGQLSKISKEKGMESFSLKSMEETLDSNEPVDNRFNEYVSNIMNKDIYILDGEKRDVYITGKDDDILYKRRDSIVLLYSNHHYELVGVLDNGVITTLFDFSDPFIVMLRNRM